MKRNIIFSLLLLLAMPTAALAQAEADEAPAKQAQQVKTREVKGLVLDAATSLPVAGAIIRVAGHDAYSTLSDDNGEYKIQVPTIASALQISSPDHNMTQIGLTTDEKQKTVRLLSNRFKGDYQQEPNLISTESTTEFDYSSAINIKEDMQQQLGAAAYSVTRNGTPGVGNVIFLQGLNSLNANAQPLVVVDGVILEQQYSRGVLHDGFFNDVLSNINPSDIEEVNVIRNGTALYGARGANGVIQIKTRRCTSLTTHITARASMGVTFEPKYISMMNAEQYRGYASELLKGTGTRTTEFKFLNADPDYYYYKQYHNETDWKDQVYRNAFSQNYGISVSGGDDVAKYNLSVGFTNNQSTLEYNDMNRINVRFNTDVELTKNLSVRFDASFSNTTRDIRDDGAPLQYDEGTPTSPSFLAYVKAPFMSPYAYGNGELSDSYLDVTDESYLSEALYRYNNYNWQLGNPWALNEYAEAANKNRLESSLLNIAVTPTYKFKHNITLSEHFAYTLANVNNKYYIPLNGVPSYYVSSVSAYRENEVRSLASKQNSVQSDTRIDWNNRYGAHKIDVFGGVRVNMEDYGLNSQLGYNTGSDKTPFMTASLLNAKSEGDKDVWRNLDTYLQANYNYMDRYYAQVNLTASGSSRFGVDANGLKLFDAVWALFPSVQGAWVVSNENWLASSEWLDYLRLSAGYDISGNDDIDVYASRSYFRAQMYLNAISGLSFSGIGNTNIKWETTRRANLGAEANFLNNRLHAAINTFYSVTDDLLSLQSIGYLSGIEQNWANGGRLQNSGFDISLSAKLVNTKNWTWQLGVTGGHYRNEIKELVEGQQGYNTDVYGATIRTQVGQAANVFYGLKTLGVFATTEEAEAAGLYKIADNGVDKNYFGAGDMHYLDVNGDHQINEKDRVIIGNPNPDFYGNFMSRVTYKNFALDVKFNYCLGNDVYNYMRSQLEGGSRFMNQTTALTQRWQSEGQVTNVPKVTFQDQMGNSAFSDRWIEDGSYLRLKSATLSYDLPLNSQFIQGLQLWIQGNNLFTFTNYLGSDPEFSGTSSVIGQGIDLGRLGQSRSVIAGIKINL